MPSSAGTTHTRQQLETVHNTHLYVNVETRGLHAPVLRGDPRRTGAPGELGIASAPPQARPSSAPRYTASTACGEHCYLQGQDVLLRPPSTCQTGVLRLLISPAFLNPSASTRCSAENHETTLILATVSRSLPHGPVGFPSPASSASTACHQRRQPGGIPPHNGRAGKICRCDTPAQPHGDLGPKNRTPAPVTNASADEKNSLVVVRGVRRVSPQQILSRSI